MQDCSELHNLLKHRTLQDNMMLVGLVSLCMAGLALAALRRVIERSS